MDPTDGPAFPAEAETTTPFSKAEKAAIATGSSYKGTMSKPIEMEITSTPSAIAWSKPASMSEANTPWAHATLYIAILARGAIPLAVPLA
ncbi:hypothetical protein VIGAN_05131200 [Vigna angularis var. angularis]|uniref:Uncharacterized protein n=1 Tax=Vigna angularis var. angularis TaxID=157739 RepID=A0A0S3S506_PHAAN|nr:hypothetical protein VIGAN_05131200 [Vigna angularis var. angularis]